MCEAHDPGERTQVVFGLFCQISTIMTFQQLFFLKNKNRDRNMELRRVQTKTAIKELTTAQMKAK